MATDYYHLVLDKLNDAQREAAKWDIGALIVLAGPGSGKTAVLTCRIARLLDSTPDENFRILGLTFTNNAANEMRARVLQSVTEGGDRLFLGTFHSFCAEVLRQHGAHVGVAPSFSIFAQTADLEEVLADAVEKARKANSDISELDKGTLPIIRRLKSMLISPEDSVNELQNEELRLRIPTVYQYYEAELHERNALDFESLIYKVNQLFGEFPLIARHYRIVYRYICIDEFQDTNLAQYSLIRNMTGQDFNNVFAVADDDQIIYQWSGASHKRVTDFIKDYDAQVIQLPLNYRCPGNIVKLANRLIKYNFLRRSDKVPLMAYHVNEKPDEVRLLGPFKSVEDEAIGITQDIVSKHFGQYGGVAVLARNRKLLDIAINALNQMDVPAVIQQRKDEFQSLPMVWLHSILRLANERQNLRVLENVCGAYKGITGVNSDPEEIRATAESMKGDFLKQWASNIETNCQTAKCRRGIELVKEYLLEIGDYREFIAESLVWLDNIYESQSASNREEIAQDSGLYLEERQAWDALFEEIIQGLTRPISLDIFLQELQMRSKEGTDRPGTVLLHTIHGAKGKEFDHVYLMGLIEDELPSFQSKKKGDHSLEMEEERRNCFVAITRASFSLTLSFSSMHRGFLKQPSRFLREMGLIN